MKLFIYILSFCLITEFVFSNTKIIIKDKNTKHTLSNVTVHFIALDGKSKDSIVVLRSNKVGELINPCKSKTAIFCRYIGYNEARDTLLGNEKERTIFMVQSAIKTEEVIVTGQIVPGSSQQSVYDIKTINEAKIFEKASVNLRDLLMTEANMKISNDGILGSDISINGISGSNIKLLIDGVPVIGRLNGIIDISQINLNNIQKVEIVEGPMSSMFGTDALGGVINLITKDANCERFEVDAGSLIESVGTYNLDAAMRYSFDNYNFMINGGRNLFRGFDKDESKRNVQWNPKEQYFADFQASYNYNDMRIKYTSTFFNEFIWNKGNLTPPYFEYATDDKYFTNRWTNSLFFNGKISNSMFYDLVTAYSWYERKRNTFFKDMVTLEEQLINDEAQQDTSVFTNYMIRGTLSDDNLNEFLKYQAGFEVNNEIAKGKKILDEKKSLLDAAGFMSLSINPSSSIIIQPSVRVIYNSEYDAPIVPALNLKIAFDKDLIFRASYAKGFRAPSLRELYLLFVDINHNIQGNADLKAEKSDSYNAGIILQTNNENYYAKIEPKIFYNKITDLITLANIEGSLYQNVNIGDYETIGGNITMQYLRRSISLTSTFSYTGRINYARNDTITNKYNFTPELNLIADYLIDFIDTKISLFYKYSGKEPNFRLYENTLVEYYVEDYSMMDITLSKRFYDKFTIAAGVKNVFNVIDIQSTQASSSGVHGGETSFPIGWGRTFFVKFNLKVIE